MIIIIISITIHDFFTMATKRKPAHKFSCRAFQSCLLPLEMRNLEYEVDDDGDLGGDDDDNRNDK